MIYTKLKIEQHEPHKIARVDSGAPEGVSGSYSSSGTRHGDELILLVFKGPCFPNEYPVYFITSTSFV